jgi:hypothetical protein
MRINWFKSDRIILNQLHLSSLIWDAFSAVWSVNSNRSSFRTLLYIEVKSLFVYTATCASTDLMPAKRWFTLSIPRRLTYAFKNLTEAEPAYNNVLVSKFKLIDKDYERFDVGPIWTEVNKDCELSRCISKWFEHAMEAFNIRANRGALNIYSVYFYI